MITKQQKKEIIKDLGDKLSRQKTVVFAEYAGLEVNTIQALRKKLRESGIDYKVARKTLINLAFKKAGYENVNVKELSGQVSMIIGYDNEVLPSKLVYEFAKKNDKFKILAGLVQGQYMDKDAIVRLAKLPSRQELLAQLAGGIAAPISGLLNVMQGNLKSLVYVLNSIKNSKQEV